MQFSLTTVGQNFARFLAFGYVRPFAARLQMRDPSVKRSFSVDGAESEEDAHEIMFYSLRKPATVTLKEMYGSPIHSGLRLYACMSMIMHECTGMHLVPVLNTVHERCYLLLRSGMLERFTYFSTHILLVFIYCSVSP